MERIVNALDKLNWGKRAYAVLVFCAATAIAVPAQTFTTLHSFDGKHGQYPYAGLVQATDGDLYGTAQYGGSNSSCILFYGRGRVFKITLGGTFTELHGFLGNPSDGAQPSAGLIQATNGDLYGTTTLGGGYCAADGCGTIFKITLGGILTQPYDFCSQTNCADGNEPYGGLVQATNGDLYGTTAEGGANCLTNYGCGTVFKITPGGTLTTLYSFCPQSGCVDGRGPFGGLIQATDGDFYGTTYYGGANGSGTIFKIAPSGALTTLYSFCSQSSPQFPCTDGNFPGSGVGPGHQWGLLRYYPV
jgi:uncharacterized repeat protein (TIGR03803 family)